MRTQHPDRGKAFVGTCISAGMKNLDALIKMCDTAKPITHRTFRHHLDREQYQHLTRSLGYSAGRGGLTLPKDFHVGYYRSTYHQKPCVFLTHSAIEYIFVEPPFIEEVSHAHTED